MAGNYATMMIKCGRGEDTSGIIRRNKKHGKENKKAGIICFLVSVPQKVSENYMYSIKNYWMWLC